MLGHLALALAMDGRPGPNGEVPVPDLGADEALMPDAFTLANGLYLHQTRLVPIHTFTHRNKKHIVTHTLEVFYEHRIYNVLSGVWHALWLTPKQAKEFRLAAEKVDDRLFELHKHGLNLPLVGAEDCLLAFTDEGGRPGTGRPLVCTPDGVLWRSSSSSTVVTPFLLPQEAVFEPELCFFWPPMEHLGHEDDDEYWKHPGFGDQGERRITVCSATVRRAIEKAGMWGYYHPKGEARKDPDLAFDEAMSIKENLIRTKLDELPLVQRALRSTEEENTALRKRVSALEDEAARQELVVAELESKIKAEDEKFSQEMLQRVAHAEARAKKAEEKLRAARENNPGWDWSLFDE